MELGGYRHQWAWIGYAGDPATYDNINWYNSRFSPSTVHCSNTGLAQFFANYLLTRVFSVFKFELPDWWDRDYFLYTLYLNGFLAVINTRSYGVIPQECGISGMNVYYRPNKVLIANPLLKINKELDIATDTELIRLTPNYRGILDIVYFFADNMALCAEACGVNVLNSKLSFLFMTDNKAAAESFKKAYDSYASGQPMTVMGNKDLFGIDGKQSRYEFFNKDVKSSYVVDQLFNALRQWELSFDNYVGIPNNPITKKERLIEQEIESNNVETRTLSDVWLETLKTSIEKVNKLFNLHVSVKYQYDFDYSEKGGIAGGNVDIRSRPLQLRQ